jgi:hypothetical protein
LGVGEGSTGQPPAGLSFVAGYRRRDESKAATSSGQKSYQQFGAVCGNGMTVLAKIKIYKDDRELETPLVIRGRITHIWMNSRTAVNLGFRSHQCHA